MKMSSSFISQEAERKLLVVVFLILYALFTFRAYVWQDFNIKYEGKRYDMVKSVQLTASKPFAYRTLLTRLSSAIEEQIYPSTCEALIQNQMALETYIYELTAVKLQKRYLMDVYESQSPSVLCRMVIVKILMGVFLVVAVGASYLFAAEIFGKLTPEALLSPLLILGCYSLSNPIAHFYDTATLAFCAILYCLMIKQKWGWFCIIYTISCFNKETTLIATVLFGLWFFDRMPRKKFLVLLVLQLLIFALIRLYLDHLIAENSGDIVEQYRFVFFGGMVFGGQSLIKVMGYLTVFFLVGFKWMEKPVILRRSIYAFVLLWLAYLLWGYPGEYRVFRELYPLLMPLIIHTLVTSTGLNRARIFKSLNTSDAALAKHAQAGVQGS